MGTKKFLLGTFRDLQLCAMWNAVTDSGTKKQTNKQLNQAQNNLLKKIKINSNNKIKMMTEEIRTSKSFQVCSGKISEEQKCLGRNL